MTTTAEELELIHELALCDDNPLRFCKLNFAEEPRAFQAEILRTIGNHLQDRATRCKPLQIAIASGHGIGKTALISMILSWGLSTCPNARAVITAGTGTQLQTKTEPEIGKWFRRGLNAHWFEIRTTSVRVKESPDNWRADCITWSADNPQAFAGLHNQGSRIIIVFDEASTIDDVIWETTAGSLTDEKTEIIWLAFGQPTHLSGKFFRCFHGDKHRWITKQIDSREVPGTNAELFQQWAEDYGEDSDFFRVRVRGVFPRSAAAQFIPQDVVTRCQSYTAVETGLFPKIAALDVARFGSDATVLGYRQGRKAVIYGKYRGKDATWVAAEACRFLDEVEPQVLVVDEDGIGGPVLDIIRSRGYQNVTGFNGGPDANDSRLYFNRRAEIWGKLKLWLEAGAEIPKDNDLADELCGPEYYFAQGKRNNGSIQLESKEQMKARGLASPDQADCLAMTFSIDVRPKPQPKPDHQWNRIVQQAGEQSWMA